MSYIKPILILFFIVNLSIILGGLEGWLGWNFIGILAFVIAFAKFVFLVAVTKGVLLIAGIDNNPLVLTGLIFSVFVVMGNSYYENFQYAFHQKMTIGGALEIKASELHFKNDLFKTPYVKIGNSGLSEVQYFEKNSGKTPPHENNIKYNYARILNTKEPTFIINYYHNEDRLDIKTITKQLSKNEITARVLPKKTYFSALEGLQLFVTKKTFDEYYQKCFVTFINFIAIVNGVALVFSLLFVFVKYRHT